MTSSRGYYGSACSHDNLDSQRNEPRSNDGRPSEGTAVEEAESDKQIQQEIKSQIFKKAKNYAGKVLKMEEGVITLQKAAQRKRLQTLIQKAKSGDTSAFAHINDYISDVLSCPDEVKPSDPSQHVFDQASSSNDFVAINKSSDVIGTRESHSLARKTHPIRTSQFFVLSLKDPPEFANADSESNDPRNDFKNAESEQLVESDQMFQKQITADQTHKRLSGKQIRFNERFDSARATTSQVDLRAKLRGASPRSRQAQLVPKERQVNTSMPSFRKHQTSQLRDSGNSMLKKKNLAQSVHSALEHLEQSSQRSFNKILRLGRDFDSGMRSFYRPRASKKSKEDKKNYYTADFLESIGIKPALSSSGVDDRSQDGVHADKEQKLDLKIKELLIRREDKAKLSSGQLPNASLSIAGLGHPTQSAQNERYLAHSTHQTPSKLPRSRSNTKKEFSAQVEEISTERDERKRQERNFLQFLQTANLSMTKKRQAIKEFYDAGKSSKDRLDFKAMVKRMAKQGKLSEFAFNDLLRLNEVTEQFYEEYRAKTQLKAVPFDDDEVVVGKPVTKEKHLLIKQREEERIVIKLVKKNRKRLRELDDQLRLSQRDSQLKMRDFESYERQKVDRFSWMRVDKKPQRDAPAATTPFDQVAVRNQKAKNLAPIEIGAELQNLLRGEQKQKLLSREETAPIDTMLSFKERTPADQLKKWEKNLQIKTSLLCPRVETPVKATAMTKKEQRNMIKEIAKRKKDEEAVKMAKLASKLRPRINFQSTKKASEKLSASKVAIESASPQPRLRSTGIIQSAYRQKKEDLDRVALKRDKQSLNELQALIRDQEKLSKKCDITIRSTQRNLKQEQSFQLGFKLGPQITLKERPDRRVRGDPDSDMCEVSRIKPADIKQARVREFAIKKDKDLLQKIWQHNSEILDGGVDFDLQYSGNRQLELQVKRTVNEKFQQVKKGSAEYLAKENADRRRFRDFYNSLQQKFKLSNAKK